jgi:hypothetical protein
VKTTVNYNNRHTSLDEQRLYDHLLACVTVDSPDQMLERFQALFIDGCGYSDKEIVASLDAILNNPDVEEYFRFILNRCCHILINRWQTNKKFQPAIPYLVDLLEQPSTSRPKEYSRARAVRRLRQVNQSFLETEQYLSLKRLARIIEARAAAQYKPVDETVPLGSLINRYPYLYEHCLVTEDSDLQHQHLVRNMQTEAQHQFECDLSHYVAYRVRRLRLQRQGQEKALKQLRTINNPTLLNDKDLVSSLKQFSARRERGQSYRDAARQFTLHQPSKATFRQFKENLYDYLVADIDPNYGKRQFNKMLQQQLFGAYTDRDSKPVDDFLMVRTCSNLFNFMVVDPSAGRQHFVFVDLINNLGAVLTTGLLLRILLICNKVRPFLERRFALLFNHYETSTSDSVSWLVNVLENINIALSLNFGNVDLSFAGTR